MDDPDVSNEVDPGLSFARNHADASRPYGRENTLTTGVPRSYKNALPNDPTVGLCLGSQGGPSGVDVLFVVCLGSQEGPRGVDVLS